MNKHDVAKAVERGIRNAEGDETHPLTWNGVLGYSLLGSSVIMGLLYQSWIVFLVLAVIALVGTYSLSYIVTVMFAVVNTHLFYVFLMWSDMNNQYATEYFWASVGAFFVISALGLGFTRSLRKGR